MEPRFIASFWTLAGNSHPLTCAGVSALPLEVRAEAAAEAGFSGFAFLDTDLCAIRSVSRWRNYSAIRRLLEACGLDFVEIELIADWFTTGERKLRSDRIRDQLLEAAAELGAHHVKVVGDFAGEHPPSEMVDSFSVLCDAASKAGTKIAIELTPLTNLVKPEAGIELVRSSGASNAGLLLDIWHIGRAGIPYEALADIPKELIIGVELDDADLEVRGTLLHDTMTHRRLCGQGDLQPARFIAAVRRAGYKNPYGVEIISDAHRALPVALAARLALESARGQFILAERRVSEMPLKE
jgi:sugar phosphate isomerase/epimerase